MSLLSKTAIESYYHCGKKFEYLYVDRVEPVYQSKEMVFGLRGHEVLEQLFKHLPVDWSTIDLPALDKAKLAVLTTAWESVVGIPERCTSEAPFDLEFLGIKGICDALAPAVDYSTVDIWEHKFTSTDFSADGSEWWWQQWKTTWQTGMYLLAANYLLPESKNSILLNAIRVPQQRQGKNEPDNGYIDRIRDDIEGNPGRYFAQARVSWSPEALARLENDLHSVRTAIEGKNFGRSRRCWEYRRRCEFYATCFEGQPLTNDKLYRIRTRP